MADEHDNDDEEDGDNPMPQFGEDGVEIVAVVDPTIDLETSTGDVGFGATGVGLGGSVPTSVGVALGGPIVD